MSDGTSALSGYKQVIFEYWNVPEENRAQWKDYYQRFVIEPLKKADGYGASLFLEPGMPWWPHPMPVFTAHPGMLTRGVFTKTSINLHNLLQHEWTDAVIHFMAFSNMRLHYIWEEEWEKLNPDWRERHPDLEERGQVITREFFSLVINHWDVTYDVKP